MFDKEKVFCSCLQVDLLVRLSALRDYRSDYAQRLSNLKDMVCECIHVYKRVYWQKASHIYIL